MIVSQDLLERFHHDLITHGRSPNTARAYVSDVRSFLKHKGPSWEDAETDFGVRAREYVTDLTSQGEMSVSSITRAMSSIRAFRTYMMNVEGRDLPEPFVGFRAPKRGRASSHPLPRGMDDVDAMVAASYRPHHRLLVALCGYAGLRVTEARSVTPRSLMETPDGWWLTVWGKGGAYREVPVNDKLLAILQSVPETEPDRPFVDISDRAARKAVTDIGVRANVSRPVSSHELRHTFGTHVYNQTLDLRVTQELLGHSSSSTTEGYTGVAQAAMRKAVS